MIAAADNSSRIRSGLSASRRGRLTAFFFLYMTEGIPLGFNTIAVTALMRRQGIGPEIIGAFVATLYLPWSWKWIMGPIVDLVQLRRWGPKRTWIVGCQTMMMLTLLAASGIDFARQFPLFAGIILLHNVFAATMDVAIDALACATLAPEERGSANGLMFAGAYLGNAVGGSGVLFLLPYVSVTASFLFVTLAILAVTAFVSLRLVDPSPKSEGPAASLSHELVRYFRGLFAACFGSAAGIAGVIFALLPAGAYGLGLALQSNLAVELGLDDPQIGWLSLWSTVAAAVGCVVGGHLSDRFGRRRTLTIYILLTALPTIWLAQQLYAANRIMPQPAELRATVSSPSLVTSLWIAACTYNAFQGLMYGARTALFMDLCRLEVAATQFTAYMSLMNVAMAYSAWWQGLSAARWGYPLTLLLDAALGCVCCVPLFWINVRSPSRTS